MIAVIFEVEPHADQKQLYLDLAADLKPLLENFDGFISVERFQSLTDYARQYSAAVTHRPR